MANPLISIIVPVYKAEKHLPPLVRDIQKQTFSEWELILVDDGSPDNTLNVCKNLAKEDDRIHVFTQVNQGPSAARNTGIDKARGKWVTFVDADDALLDNFLLSMITVGESNSEIDLVYAGYIIVNPTSTDIYTYETKTYIGRSEVRDALAYTKILHRCCPWGRMFLKSVIDDFNIRFDVQLRHSEDRLFVYNYLIHTRGIATTSAIGYVYDSTSTTSLKNHHLDYDMLWLRQQKLQDATHSVIDHFGMKGEECFMFAKHLFGLFSTSIQSIFEDMVYSRDAIVRQSNFYESFFDAGLYNEVCNCEKWIRYVQNDMILKKVIGKEFKTLNKYWRIISRKIAISRVLSKFSCKSHKRQEFLTTVKILN